MQTSESVVSLQWPSCPGRPDDTDRSQSDTLVWKEPESLLNVFCKDGVDVTSGFS